jgi:hypothetical protein
MLGLIAAALGAVRAGVGMAGARKEANRQRNMIHSAYARGQQRLGVKQQDVRQQEGESLIARGLAGGGDVHDSGPVGAGADLGVGGARTLGGQQLTDLHREQGLEQNELLAQRDNALSDVGAQGTQNTINAIGSGISTAMSVYGAGQELGAARTAGAPGPAPAPTPAPGTGIGTIRGAYGLDPITARPQWLPPSETGHGTAMGDGQANYNFRVS